VVFGSSPPYTTTTIYPHYFFPYFPYYPFLPLLSLLYYYFPRYPNPMLPLHAPSQLHDLISPLPTKTRRPPTDDEHDNPSTTLLTLRFTTSDLPSPPTSSDNYDEARSPSLSFLRPAPTRDEALPRTITRLSISYSYPPPPTPTPFRRLLTIPLPEELQNYDDSVAWQLAEVHTHSLLLLRVESSLLSLFL